MKKYISILVCAVLMLTMLTACGNSADNQTEKRQGAVSVVTTVFPMYDWVREIVGDNDNVDITMLLDSGVDLHSYQPTAEDILKISTCDLFIYVGGESDGWVEAALSEATNKNMKVMNLLDILGDCAKEEELVEGMQAAAEEGEEAEHEETEYDEHIWLSLKNAQILCETIADIMSEIDSENADTYQANVKDYDDKLKDLDARYQLAVSEGNQKTILFGDRFPFRYMADDYGLDYYAAFSGCSAEAEASFETIMFLAGKVDELGLPAVLQIESADGSIAETIISNTKNKNQDILTLNSMQSTTSKDVETGASYISIMEDNLSVLKAALQ